MVLQEHDQGVPDDGSLRLQRGLHTFNYQPSSV